MNPPSESIVLELARTVRFSIPLAVLQPGGGSAVPSDGDPAGGRWNTFAGWPSAAGLALYCEWNVRCHGREDPRTGYLISIAELDTAVRATAIEPLAAAMREDPARSPARLLADAVGPLDRHLDGRVHAVTWRLTPFHSVTVERDRMDRFEMRQQFDFAAAHHLRSPELDDAANRRIFGKCTNAHGHNYRVEVAVSVPLPDGGCPPVLTLPGLERIVDERVIDPMDHTDLNRLDGLFGARLPSVENIARVCHEQLEAAIEAAGAELVAVTVWETEKTSCTYPAPPRPADRPAPASSATTAG